MGNGQARQAKEHGICSPFSRIKKESASLLYNKPSNIKEHMCIYTKNFVSLIQSPPSLVQPLFLSNFDGLASTTLILQVTVYTTCDETKDHNIACSHPLSVLPVVSERDRVLTGDKFANTPGSFQEVAHGMQGHFYETDDRADEARDQARHHIDRALKGRECDLEDGRKEVLEESYDGRHSGGKGSLSCFGIKVEQIVIIPYSI